MNSGSLARADTKVFLQKPKIRFLADHLYESIMTMFSRVRYSRKPLQLMGNVKKLCNTTHDVQFLLLWNLPFKKIMIYKIRHPAKSQQVKHLVKKLSLNFILKPSTLNSWFLFYFLNKTVH